MNVIDAAELRRDLLRAVLVDHVAVGHLDRVAYTRLISCWPLPASPFENSTGTPAPSIAVADGADHVLVARRLEDVVVLDHLRVRREVGVALGRGLLERLAEQEELELATRTCSVKPEAAAARSTWRCRMRRGDTSTGAPVSSSSEVAQHERGRLEPGDRADRGEVGLRGHVAVALLPVRELVAGQHVHLDVDREQVVAHVQRLVRRAHLLAPVVPGDPLADEPALQVGERDEHGVDRARCRSPPSSSSAVSIPRTRHAAHGSLSYSGVTYAAVMPPSTTSDAPVMNDASSDARKSAAFASSSALPEPAHRDVHHPPGAAGRGRRGAPRAAASGSGPGHSAFARMPWRAYSTAISRVIDEHAALARRVRDLRGRRAHRARRTTRR